MKKILALATLNFLFLGHALAADSNAPALYLDPAQPIEKHIDDLIGRLTLQEKGAMLCTTAPAIGRLAIPVFNGWNQCLRGVQWSEPTTLFPCPIGLAATWNTQLVRQVASVIGDEARAIFNRAGRHMYTVYASLDQVPPQSEYDVTKGHTYLYFGGTPQFVFGHGLSYTTFQYDNLRLSNSEIVANGQVTVRLDVKNTGTRAGDEVVQLYVHQVKSSVKRPAKELRGFERLSLKPGEQKTVTLTLPAEKLAFYDEKTHRFVVEPGLFDVMIAGSSSDIRVKGQLQVVQ